MNIQLVSYKFHPPGARIMTDHNNKYMHLLLIFGNDSKKN